VAHVLKVKIDDLFIFDDEPEPESPEHREVLVD
jgi:hypothetical protein